MMNTRSIVAVKGQGGKMFEEQNRTTIDPKQCGERRYIRGGMRIRVVNVPDLFAAGLDAGQILDETPDLERADSQAALRYAARTLDHPVLAA